MSQPYAGIHTLLKADHLKTGITFHPQPFLEDPTEFIAISRGQVLLEASMKTMPILLAASTGKPVPMKKAEMVLAEAIKAMK